MALSTEKSYLDVFDAFCPGEICNVKQKYDKDLSLTYTPSNSNLINFQENQTLGENKVTLEGAFGGDDFRIRMNGFNRETVLPTLDFARLICSSCESDGTSYSSSFDGWIGISPYNRSSMMPTNNFMYQLEHVQKMIDNSVVMLNVDTTKGNSSILKFGGYDSISSTNGSLNVFQTNYYFVPNTANSQNSQNHHLWNVGARSMNSF